MEAAGWHVGQLHSMEALADIEAQAFQAYRTWHDAHAGQGQSEAPGSAKGSAAMSGDSGSGSGSSSSGAQRGAKSASGLSLAAASQGMQHAPASTAARVAQAYRLNEQQEMEQQWRQRLQAFLHGQEAAAVVEAILVGWTEALPPNIPSAYIVLRGWLDVVRPSAAQSSTESELQACPLTGAIFGERSVTALIKLLWPQETPKMQYPLHALVELLRKTD